ncbi:MAG: hypothetical protein UCO86_10905, partial [Eggerthella lenta]|nr:hypothetical protein [Eggerthella lenta]
MMENTLVYHGAHAPIEELLDHAIKNPVRLDARDVEVVEAARAVEGEVWSPQLPAYRAWAAEGEAGDVAGGAGREGDLYSAGALWMGEFDELLAQAAERDAADAQETPRARMEEGLRGAVGVRQVPGGYALTAFDLRRFAAAVGQSDDLAVLLPAYVDGIPVVRVAVEAFARRFVQGVGVLLLVVPDTVEHIAANAFAAMSAQRIHIGRGVSQLGEQRCDLAGVSPRLARREYSVDAGNARYLAREGNLFSDGGRELVFLASPYG